MKIGKHWPRKQHKKKLIIYTFLEDKKLLVLAIANECKTKYAVQSKGRKLA